MSSTAATEQLSHVRRIDWLWGGIVWNHFFVQTCTLLGVFLQNLPQFPRALFVMVIGRMWVCSQRWNRLGLGVDKGQCSCSEKRSSAPGVGGVRIRVRVRVRVTIRATAMAR